MCTRAAPSPGRLGGMRGAREIPRRQKRRRWWRRRWRRRARAEGSFRPCPRRGHFPKHHERQSQRAMKSRLVARRLPSSEMDGTRANELCAVLIRVYFHFRETSQTPSLGRHGEKALLLMTCALALSFSAAGGRLHTVAPGRRGGSGTLGVGESGRGETVAVGIGATLWQTRRTLITPPTAGGAGGIVDLGCISLGRARPFFFCSQTPAFRRQPAACDRRSAAHGGLETGYYHQQQSPVDPWIPDVARCCTLCPPRFAIFFRCSDPDAVARYGRRLS